MICGIILSCEEEFLCIMKTKKVEEIKAKKMMDY